MTKTYNRPRFVSDVISYEVNPAWSRDAGILKSGNATVIGTVLGVILLGAASVAAKTGGNTGNGTVAMDATNPVLAGAKAGVYTVRFTAATAFTVEDPNGDVIGNGATGAAFADDIKFTITAGGTAFVAGDEFDITVAAAAIEKFVPINFSANDGSQIAAGISLDEVAAQATDRKIAVEVRGAALNPDFLVWPSGATAAQKAAALATLKALGLVARASN